MAQKEIQKLNAEIKKALQTCPPWHRVCIGVDGKVHVYAYTPPKMFGQSTDGLLFTETADA